MNSMLTQSTLRLALLFGGLVWPCCAAASELPEALLLMIGQGQLLHFPEDVTRVYTSNPDVADVAVIDAREVVVNGKAVGRATVAFWLQSGQSQTSTVSVEMDLSPIQKILDQAFPDDKITVLGSKEAMILKGQAAKALTVDRALALLKPFAQSTVSNVDVVPRSNDKQIALHVLFAELDRSTSDSFGMNLLSTGGANTPGQTTTGQFSPAATSQLKSAIGNSVSGTGSTFDLASTLNIFAFRPDLNLALTIQALQSKGLLQILAQPDLVTTDGKEARFTVGGEFPIPVPQTGAGAGAITVQFREFGIRLSFTPNLNPDGTIRLHVQPEVSTLDAANGIVLSGFNIPALSTRKVDTEVELREGQSFVIAGLLDDRVTRNLSKIPGIGDIPILGALFRSHSVSRSKTELIIVVTPEVRSPLPRGATVPVPQMPETFLPTSKGSPK